MKKYLSFPNDSYLILFILLSTFYLFINFSYSDQPLDVRVVNLFFSFFITVFVYVFYLFIFFMVSHITAAICKKFIKSSHQDPAVPETFILANILFIFLLGIYLDQYIKANADPKGEISLVGIALYIEPFFTSFFGGILSGSLVVLSKYDNRKVIKVGRIASVAAVLIYFAYRFITIKL